MSYNRYSDSPGVHALISMLVRGLLLVMRLSAVHRYGNPTYSRGLKYKRITVMTSLSKLAGSAAST
jgi:hypothetical protein